ncbi:hypothetical protein IJG72_00380 [bacterium]|nr:hypothetical protein [bacterium]
MKKIIITILIALMITPVAFAGDKNFKKIEKQQSMAIKNLENEVKDAIKMQSTYTEKYDKEGLLSLYSDKYYNADGFDKTIFADLIDKTWKLYPDIKYKTVIQKVDIIGQTAIAYVKEYASATAVEKVEDNEIKGSLRSESNCIYYLEKAGNKWLITSDIITNEKTTLSYGEADKIDIKLTVPQVMNAGKEYTATLHVNANKPGMVAIASIGQESITYPQINAEEVFRKLPKDGVLERVFRANTDNFNEYTVASIGITRANVAKDNEIKLMVTGFGYVITRTNIIPQKDFSKVKQNDTKKAIPKLL